MNASHQTSQKINIGRLYCLREKHKTHFCFDYNSGVSWFDFYTFCTSSNTNEYSSEELTKFTHHPNCISTLPNIKQPIL